MVQQVIQNRRGQDGVAQKLTPFPEAFVAGKHDASTFVSGTDDLKEQVGSQLFRGRYPTSSITRIRGLTEKAV
jgi:hypothetical protein